MDSYRITDVPIININTYIYINIHALVYVCVRVSDTASPQFGVSLVGGIVIRYLINLTSYCSSPRW